MRQGGVLFPGRGQGRNSGDPDMTCGPGCVPVYLPYQTVGCRPHPTPQLPTPTITYHPSDWAWREITHSSSPRPDHDQVVVLNKQTRFPVLFYCSGGRGGGNWAFSC